MKRKNVGKATFAGENENNAFIVMFQSQILMTLKKRGLLTGNQLEKGLKALKERSQ